MPDQKITEFIKEQREQKTEDPVIISTLLQAGYNKQDIDEGFALLSMTQSTEIPVNNPVPPIQQAQQAVPEEKPAPRFTFHMPGRNIMVIIAAFLVIVIGISVFLFVQSSQAPQEEEQVEEEEEAVTPEPTEEVIEEETPSDEAAPTAAVLSPEERDQKRMEDVEILQDALEKYFADMNVYPENLNLLYTKYLDKIIVDPITFTPYDYFVRQQGKSYIICVTPEGKTNRQCAEKGKNPFGASPTASP